MKVGVVVFPGSNCDRDMFHVLTDVFKIDAQFFWHEKNLPKEIDAVILPGFTQKISDIIAELPDEWDIVYLGSGQYTLEARVSAHLARPSRI